MLPHYHFGARFHGSDGSQDGNKDLNISVKEKVEAQKQFFVKGSSFWHFSGGSSRGFLQVEKGVASSQVLQADIFRSVEWNRIDTGKKERKARIFTKCKTVKFHPK